MKFLIYFAGLKKKTCDTLYFKDFKSCYGDENPVLFSEVRKNGQWYHQPTIKITETALYLLKGKNTKRFYTSEDMDDKIMLVPTSSTDTRFSN